MDLITALRGAMRGEVEGGVRRRAEFSSDASNYRVVPAVVVFPLDVEDVLAAAEISRSMGVSLTARGAGTSVAGNAVGPGVVMDMSRHVRGILELDPGSRTAQVEPGVVLADLQRAARPHGLRFGPDPSTHARATIGGMIGNNACGPHAVAYGRTADNVRALDVIDGAGRRFTAGKGLDPVAGLDSLVGANLSVLRTELGRFSRQVSGYSLEHLLPERNSDLAKALVGTEGTVVTVLGATLELVPIAPATVLVVLGYPDLPTAADAVPALLAHRPLAVEGLDHQIVDAVRRHRGAQRVPALPEGRGWLMVEVGGLTADDALSRGRALAADAGTSAVRIAGPDEQSALWRIREDGAGLAGRTADGRPAWPGWEDAAVPPERLGAYLRDFAALMAAHRWQGMVYGHFGDGCVHVRIDFPLDRDALALQEFTREAARLVAGYGGSFSGEHGDGRARSELLPLMYSAEAVSAFGAFKHLLDPRDLLNPGVLVNPAPLLADVRRPQALPLLRSGHGFAFAHDHGDFTEAVHRCVGVGKCRVEAEPERGFMCPSFVATRDEKDSTRGRARVLQEMSNGTLITVGWKSPEILESLDLCLSCKACASDCPAGVDMAQYKSEALYRRYKGRLRPASHYSLGALPRWARLAGRPARAVNAVLRRRIVSTLVLRVGGMDRRRTIPPFAPQTFVSWFRRRGNATRLAAAGPRVVLWVDTFSNSFSPSVAKDALSVLTDAGFDVVVPEPACCGLTWLTTGQLGTARRHLERLMQVLGPFAHQGVPIVGLEPSCTAVLRSDLLELFPDDVRAREIAGMTVTLAEILTAPEPLGPVGGWTPPDLGGQRFIVQPHCHHHAVMGYHKDRELLQRSGAHVHELVGCCGLAGNFGMERGHYEVSVLVAEQSLLPALRDAPVDQLLADGFSCRTQADQLAGRKGRHLAEILAHPPEKGPA